MFPAPDYTMNLRGKLVELQRPWVMGILNVTPDSFYADSRTPMAEPERIAQRVRQMLAEGADIIDVGAYSSRPGADDISPLEEMQRLEVALTTVREVAPEVYVSVDTFRSEVARQCVEHFGVDLINDISGGVLDRAMPKVVARLGVPYIIMHMKGNPETMQMAPEYQDVVAEVLEFLARQQQRFFEDLTAQLSLDGPSSRLSRTSCTAPGRSESEIHDLQIAGNDASRSSQRDDRPPHDCYDERRAFLASTRCASGSRSTHSCGNHVASQLTLGTEMAHSYLI